MVTLASTANHLEWLGYSAPPVPSPDMPHANSSREDLHMKSALLFGTELDMDSPVPRWLFGITDGALSIDRSQCGIIVMYGGVAILCSSYRQHSQAKDAHESEMFSACGGGCIVHCI